MKKIKFIRLFTLLSLSILFVACNDYNDSDFRPRDTSFGWIEFNSGGRELSFDNAPLTPDSLPFARVQVNLEVITNPDGYTYTYTAQEGFFEESEEEDADDVFVATGELQEFTVEVPPLEGVSDIEHLIDPNFIEDYYIQFTLVDVSKENTTIGVEGDESSNTVHNLLVTGQGPIFAESNWNSETVGCAGDGSGNCDPDASGLEFTHPITIEPGDVSTEFILSDITGGLYAQGYGDEDNPVTVNADLETFELFVIDQDDVVYGGDVFNGTGTFTLGDEGLEGFELEWSNGWGDAGDTVFTPAD